MIAEPYICIKGKRATEIMWCITESSDGEGSEICNEHCKDGCTNCASGVWIRYADFEREKLSVLADEGCDMEHVGLSGSLGYFLHFIDVDGKETTYSSRRLCKFSGDLYKQNSENYRLIARAEFLKAVCEKEGVEWLPKSLRKLTPMPYCTCEGSLDVYCSVHGTERKQAGTCNQEACDHDANTVCTNCTKATPASPYYTKDEVDQKLLSMEWQFLLHIQDIRKHFRKRFT